jgi:hypothetical protein
MMAAGEYLDVFQGAKRRGNTPAVLPQQATPENIQILTAQRVAEIIEPEAVLASRLQPARGCAREAALPAAHSYRNGINAI